VGPLHVDDCGLSSTDSTRVLSRDDARARRESLKKLDLLLSVLNSFRAKLLAEAHAITEFERAAKRKSLKPQKSTKGT
jgi:hypothetical protein